MTIATKASTLAIGFCFPVIGAALCFGRFYFRRRKNDIAIQVDDWFALIGLLCVTGACASLITGVYVGAFFLNSEDDEAEAEHQEHAIAQITGAVVFLWFFANSSIKASILFFYRRVFRGKAFNVISWLLIALTAIWLVYSFLTGILYCGPYVRNNFEGPWNVCPAWGFQLQLATFVLDTLIDFCIIILPIPMLVKLQLEPAKKLLLILVFCVGGFAFVAGLLNTIYQFLLLTNPTSTAGVAGTPPSPTSNGQLLLLNWPVIEIGVGLIACNMPSLSLVGTRIVSEYLFKGWRVISDSINRVFQQSRGSSVSDSHRHASRPEPWSANGPPVGLQTLPKPSIERSGSATSRISSRSSHTV